MPPTTISTIAQVGKLLLLLELVVVGAVVAGRTFVTVVCTVVCTVV
jgi:hypothetical protein